MLTSRYRGCWFDRLSANAKSTGAAILAAGLLSGCMSESKVASAVKPAEKPISLAEFRAPAAAAGPQTAPATPIRQIDEEEATEEVGPARPLRTGPIAASQGLLDVSAEVGEPALDTTNPKPVGPPVFVDAKVGDVNNRAIYASAFLEDMIDRLKAKYEEMQKANPKMAKQMWRVFAKNEIQRKLNGIIEDEVLRAEALNTLQPEQKAGFFNWLQTVRSEVVAENRGIEAAANENLSAQNGTSLDQTMKTREQQELIRYILMTRINNRANVSWRDIRMAYEKNYDLFNPDPIASFRVFTVSERDKAEIQRVTDELAKGTPFDDLADSKTTGTDEKDKFLNRAFQGEYSKAQLLGPKELNQAVQKLSPGEWVGPIMYRGSAYWIKLAHVWKVNEDLYAAQLFLEGQLIQTKNDFEKYKFVERLKQRASFTDVDVMTNRLLALAEDRVFGIPTSAAR
ncbi:MAG: peptidylprolyl isomerase [Phycisphaerales bacterium]